MEITLFMETVIQELGKRLPEGVRIYSNTEDNVHEFIIYDVKNRYVQGIIIDSFYEDYIKTNNLDKVIDSFEGVIETLINEASEIEEEWQADQKYFSDFNNIKDSVYYRLISKQDMPEDVIYEDYLDMTKQYYVFYKSPGIFVDSYIGIQREHLETWNITEEELKALAEDNLKKQPVEIRELSEVLSELMLDMEKTSDTNKANINIPDEDEIKDIIYIMRNNELEFGATVMCNKTALRQFAEEQGKDIFIIPSSLHEVMLVINDENDVNMALRLEDMLYDINHTIMEPKDVLTDSIYVYKRETDTIEIV